MKHNAPGLAGVHMFLQTLNPEKSHFCVPPPYLLVDALRHFKIQQVPYEEYLELSSNIILDNNGIYPR